MNNTNKNPIGKPTGSYVSGDAGHHHRVMNKKTAVTTPDVWEPALPVELVEGFEPSAY